MYKVFVTAPAYCEYENPEVCVGIAENKSDALLLLADSEYEYAECKHRHIEEIQETQ